MKGGVDPAIISEPLVCYTGAGKKSLTGVIHKQAAFGSQGYR